MSEEDVQSEYSNMRIPSENSCRSKYMRHTHIFNCWKFNFWYAFTIRMMNTFRKREDEECAKWSWDITTQWQYKMLLCVYQIMLMFISFGVSIAFEWWWERHSHFFTKSCSAHTHSHTQTPVDIEWAQASERAKERTQNIHTYMYITIERVLLSSPLMPLRYVKELLKWAGFGFVCFVLYAHINTSIGAMNKPMWCLWFNACTKHSLASSKSYTKQFVSRHQIYTYAYTLDNDIRFLSLVWFDKPRTYGWLRFQDKYIANRNDNNNYERKTQSKMLTLRAFILYRLYLISLSIVRRTHLLSSHIFEILWQKCHRFQIHIQIYANNFSSRQFHNFSIIPADSLIGSIDTPKVYTHTNNVAM